MYVVTSRVLSLKDAIEIITCQSISSGKVQPIWGIIGILSKKIRGLGMVPGTVAPATPAHSTIQRHHLTQFRSMLSIQPSLIIICAENRYIRKICTIKQNLLISNVNISSCYFHLATKSFFWKRIIHLFRILQWRHNGGYDVSNHQPYGCLLNRLFGRISKKISKLRVTGLCEGNSLLTSEFPTQGTSNVELCQFDDVIMSRDHFNIYGYIYRRISIWLPILKVRRSKNHFILRRLSLHRRSQFVSRAHI